MPKFKPKEKPQPSGWRNRIVGHGEEEPDKLLANPKNWRIHPKAQTDALAGVLNEVGWVQDIIVNQRSGFIVDGHARVELAKGRGEKVPVVYVYLSDKEEALILASLDPLAAMAETNREALASLVGELEVTDEFVKAMLAELAGPGVVTGLTDEDAVPDVPASPVTVDGDLWLLGRHRLLCGDSTLINAVERLMAGEKADTMWTDPPYGVSYVGKTKNKLTIANDGGDVLKALLDGFLQAAGAVLVPCAPFYIAHPAGSKALVFGQAVVDAGWRVHQILCWVKDSMVLGHSDYHYKHEPILYGYTPGEGRPGRGNHAGSRWVGDHSQVSVLDVPRPKRSEEHPTMKPVELIRRCIANNTPAAGIVLDPFSGSGSTLLTCEEHGYSCRGMELAPQYADVIVKRWQEFTGKEATLDGDGRTFAQLAAERVGTQAPAVALASTE